MLDSNFSLLYPNGDQNKDDHVSITDEVISELGLDFLIDLKNSNLSDYMTTDRETIEYRNETLNDMLENPTIVDTLKGTLKLLSDIVELRRIKSETEVAKNYLYSITEIEHRHRIIAREGLSGSARQCQIERVPPHDRDGDRAFRKRILPQSEQAAR